MTGQQRTVLWIGLILVGINLVRHWKEISSIIFNGAGITSGIGSGSSGGSSGGGGITVPIDPLLPIGPKVTIPTPKIKLF